ncbi:MAG: spore protease YyaC [Clostridiales bacterium]|nr:spore protease YyaC [Clostridiales bacterium]
MVEKNFTFNTFNEHADDGIFQALSECNPKTKKPIVICIGSDLVLGDSLGPLVGTFLRKKDVRSYIYGTLNFPITAKEVDYARTYLKQMHPNSISIAIDAAVGNADDVGLIRVINKGLKPGLGVDKNLGVVGDISIVGIVATKSLQNHNLFNLTRLNLVFRMAEKIASGIEKYIAHIINNQNYISTNSFGA